MEKTGDLTSTWDEFVKLLPLNEPRFAVFNYPYTTDEKPPKHPSKLIFIGWSPDNSDVKLKMLYASRKVTFMKQLDMAKHLKATDLSDVSIDFIFERYFWIISLFFSSWTRTLWRSSKNEKEEENLKFSAINEN